MEFTGAARKHYAEHGISDADTLHVIRNPSDSLNRTATMRAAC